MCATIIMKGKEAVDLRVKVLEGVEEGDLKCLGG